MDRILSARIDDTIYRKINDLSLKLHTTKKSVIEQAIDLLGRNIQEERKSDIFSDTCGTWEREETPDETVKNVRSVFNHSMKRHER
jgi:predicted transcriptional regulator